MNQGKVYPSGSGGAKIFFSTFVATTCSYNLPYEYTCTIVIVKYILNLHEM